MQLLPLNESFQSEWEKKEARQNGKRIKSRRRRNRRRKKKEMEDEKKRTRGKRRRRGPLGHCDKDLTLKSKKQS